MGKNCYQKVIVSLFFTVFLSQYFCFSQTKITGIVKHNNHVLNNVSIVLKDTLSNAIIAYNYTNINGRYTITTKKKGAFKIEASLLGYTPKITYLNITSKSKNSFIVNILLTEKSEDLEEVVIQATKPVTVKKDTINFKTKFFTNGSEQTVEDLLKKIPGLTIEDDGTIKVGNKEIEKLMVDGDDFFGKGYKLLSKNMPSYPIEEIEVLQNYSNNKLLKSIEESNKVALNLKMNDAYKRIWFGNTSLGYGLFSENKYEFKNNIMNFGKKNKYFLLTKLNNIGSDRAIIANDFRKNSNSSENIGEKETTNSILKLQPPRLKFKKDRTHFNNEELVSLSAIFNPSKKLKLKTVHLFNTNEIDFFRNNTNTVNTNTTRFTNIENQQLRNKSKTIFGKLNIDYNISNTKTIKAVTKYNFSDFDNTSNLDFNSNKTIEKLYNTNTLFDQKITYTNKLKSKKALLITGRFIHDQTPQHYTTNQFLFPNLFPSFSNTTDISQRVNNQMLFAGVNAHFLNRKENGNLLEFQLGNLLREDKLKSVFSLLANNTVLETPNEYQNNTLYSVNDIYFKSKYLYKIASFSFAGKVDFHQLFNRLKDHVQLRTQQLFFINPSLSFKWQINELNKITSSYSYNTSNATLLNVYSNFILTGFRSFLKGTDDFNQLETSRFIFNYQLGGWAKRFFINTYLMYSKNHDFFSTNTLLSQNFMQSERILIKNRTFLTFFSNFDYFFSSINSNVKLNTGISKSEYQNIINSISRKINTTNYNYGIEARSAFKGFFNYHIGTKWTTNEIKASFSNTFTNNMSFLDLSFVFNKGFDIQLQSERYFFGNLKTNNTYYFLDLEGKYTIINNKLSIGLTGKNLLNTKNFRNSFNSDIGTSSTEYRLLPRFLLLKMNYRF
ncbi:carboxypeptidase-like regulatory domain-containing protein [uncultured Tenacibaculum sp.]|uniref:carboxypeptidase-like regulatory domain-containing protein n=1 Tax=uncultured Tenacibaculum sp. TaxID=174713 RepID=UPI0026227994|nr:carboxypeptidase-like regulatory domain-containing protein [uncultured Tenacibaculum sp.]